MGIYSLLVPCCRDLETSRKSSSRNLPSICHWNIASNNNNNKKVISLFYCWWRYFALLWRWCVCWFRFLTLSNYSLFLFTSTNELPNISKRISVASTLLLFYTWKESEKKKKKSNLAICREEIKTEIKANFVLYSWQLAFASHLSVSVV